VAFTPATLIAQAKADLEAVAGIGLVHDRRREVRDESGARLLWYHEGQGRIHAWSVTLGDGPTAKAARTPGFGPRGSGQKGTVLVDLALQIEGVMGIDDAAASEVTFRNLSWDVLNAFNAIGLLTADTVHQDPLQWERFGYLLLAGAYHVHYTRMTGRYTGRV
jgi:hypothetical protein